MLGLMVRRLWCWKKEGPAWSLESTLALAMFCNIGTCLVSRDFTAALDSPVLTGAAAVRYLVPAYLFGSVLAALELPDILLGITPRVLRWTCGALSGCGVILATGWFVSTELAHWKEEPAISHGPGKIAGAWLSAHGLTHGVGDYWAGLLVTALTRGQVSVGAVTIGASDKLSPYRWVSKLDWYQGRPQFVIYQSNNIFGITTKTITNTYGPPVSIEHVAGYSVAQLAPGKAVAHSSHE